MFREFLDEVLDPSLQPDDNPRYTIRDNNGKVINDNVQIDLKTPVVQNPTPLNRANISNLQGDLYTQDRYNSLTYSGNAMILDLPLTSYQKGKIVNITAPASLSNPSLNINSLGVKTVNGNLISGNTYTLVYNGSSWDILAKDYIIGTYTGDGESTQTISLGFTPSAIIVADELGKFYGYNGANFYSGGIALNGVPAKYNDDINLVEIVDSGFEVRYISQSSTRISTNATNEVYKYIAFK